MAIWSRVGTFLSNLADRTGIATLGAALDPDNWLPGGREAAFTLSLVALLAKMAVADGVVTSSEDRAFRMLVQSQPGSEAQIERLYLLAQQDVAGYESYARKISKLFPDSPETLERVLDALFQIAAADGFIHEAEFDYLKTVSDIFGFDEVRFEQIAAGFLLEQGGQDPYLVLGLSAEAPFDEVKRVYRRLAAEYHPDRLAAAGVPEEMMALANGRMAAINAAYDIIEKAHRA